VIKSIIFISLYFHQHILELLHSSDTCAFSACSVKERAIILKNIE